MSDVKCRWPLLAAAFARLGRPVVIVDLETTGGNMLADRITEVAMLRFEQGRVMQRGWLVNPQMPIPPFITGLTGIDDGMVKNAPVFAELAKELLPFLQGAVVVAHNSRFDYTFLRHEFQRAGMDFAAPALCTVQLSRKLYPQFHKHNLDSIIERCGIEMQQRHRAMADVLALAEFLEKALSERGAQEFEARSRALMNPKMLPAWLSPDLTDQLYALPDRHGVLVWLDKGGQALHMGEHEHVFSAVASHLHVKRPDYAERAARVRFIPAVGGLHALWLKAQLANEYGLKHEQGMKTYLTVRFRPDEAGALQAKIEPLYFGKHHQKPFGLFLHKKSAKRALTVWAAEMGLCPSALDILPQTYVRGVPCPMEVAGKCRGGCASEGGNPLHNELVLASAGLLPVADWGKMHEVEITETDGLSGQCFTFHCAGGALSLPDGSWYFDESLPAVLKTKFKMGSRVVKMLG